MTVTESRAAYRPLQQQLELVHRRYPQARLRVRIDSAGQYAAGLERFLRQIPPPLEIAVGEPGCNKGRSPKPKAVAAPLSV